MNRLTKLDRMAAKIARASTEKLQSWKDYAEATPLDLHWRTRRGYTSRYELVIAELARRRMGVER